jgi:hypothetical protein
LAKFDQEIPAMMRLTLATGAFVLALTAVAPSASALYQPPWVVVQWTNGDCKIWRNVFNAPLGGGWRSVAFANSYDVAWGKLRGLQAKRKCNL